MTVGDKTLTSELAVTSAMRQNTEINMTTSELKLTVSKLDSDTNKTQISGKNS